MRDDELLAAATRANRATWRLIEMALADYGPNDWVKALFRRVELEPLCPALKVFLDSVPLTADANPTENRTKALAELRSALKCGPPKWGIDVADLRAACAGEYLGLVAVVRKAAVRVIGGLERAAPHLAIVLESVPPGEPRLLDVALVHFLRRELALLAEDGGGS